MEKYTLSLTLDPAADLNEFSANVKIALKLTAPGDRIEFDREALTINKVEAVAGKRTALKWEDQDPNLVTVLLNTPAKTGERFVLDIAYTGKIGTNHRGFFKVKDPDAPERGPLYFTHFEPLAASAFFPGNNEPYDKAAVEIKVTLPPGYEAVANGKRLADRKVMRNKSPWREISWAQTNPHSTYLVSLAVGKFQVATDDKKQPPITVYANPKKMERATYTAETTRKTMTILEDYLATPYPWDKYATIGLPTFLWGGMENTSSTHMNEERMLLNDPKSSKERYHVAGLVAHELAHQWFGNFVTLKWWNDVWLNEAFATYMTLVAEKKLFPNERPDLEFVSDTWEGYFKQEDGPRSHAIVQATIETPDDGFDSISYTKGANVLRMLSFYLGEDRFRKAIKLYLRNHAYSIATYVDFFKSVELATGEDLSAFRDSWLLKRGYPIIRYSGTWDKATSRYQLTLKQSANHPEDKTLFRFRMPVVFRRKAKPAFEKSVSVTMGDALRTEKFELPAEPEMVSVNPGGIVLARVKSEQLGEKGLALHALGDLDPVLRYWASLELAEGLIQNKSISHFAEKTLGYVLEQDKSPYVRTALLGILQKTPQPTLPQGLSETIIRLAKASLDAQFASEKAFLADPFGWREYRSSLLGTLGRVGNEEAVAVLEKALSEASLPLDDLLEASRATAQIGGDRALGILKTALQIHTPRGYRYQFHVQMAFASLRDPRAVAELKQILTTCGPDFAGRVGRPISENPPVRSSAEWASFLGDFLVNDLRLGDEVKARILSSIEQEKNSDVKKSLLMVVEKSQSERIRALSRQILAKNFGVKDKG